MQITTSRLSTLASMLLASTVSGFLPSAAHAQGEAAKPATCMTLLTAEELTKAVGAKMEDMGGQTRDAGESECPWMLRGGGSFKTVSVQFYDGQNIKASPSAPTPDAFFELMVSAGEGVASGKRQLLPGIGQKTALVPTDPQLLVIVQRADGIARIVANNLTKAQITAVAKAVATP